jgi:hypothetical protein
MALEQLSRHPNIEFTVGANGRLKSYVKGGLAVWEYVFTAKAYEMDVEKTADHLTEPEERVRAALEYYHDHPDEVDERLARMNEIEADPARHLPDALLPTPPVRDASAAG